MQSVTDFQALRDTQQAARMARRVMCDLSLPQPRRELATEAYVKSVDRVMELLERLNTQPISAQNSRPTLDVLGEVLLAIEQAEAAFAEVEHGAGN